MALQLFTRNEGKQADLIRKVVYTNPFSEERKTLEEKLFGRVIDRAAHHWQDLGKPPESNAPLILELIERAEYLAKQGLKQLGNGGTEPDAVDLDRYVHLVWVVVYHRSAGAFDGAILKAHETGSCPIRFGFYERFCAEMDRYFRPGNLLESLPYTYAHIFAICFQLRRAFFHIFTTIIGSSAAATRLRARVWDSTFTHNAERYQRSLYTRMSDIVTLITGPSGSGKELVARGIGLSRFIPFDPSRRAFEEDFIRGFYPVNLSALSPTLIESELFGHRKGAFTGALQDRQGFFEACGACGTVFLDEIGETSPETQVKLLRVLQTRGFQRLGDTEPRRFTGKAVTATNRDLASEMEQGRFREDFYYRLCADRIETPALHEILEGNPEEVSSLVRYIAGKVAGPAEADLLTEEVVSFISNELGAQYAWPGNFRELEQCVRNILVSGEYSPPRSSSRGGTGQERLASDFLSGAWTHETLLRSYFPRVYEQCGRNLEEASRRLGVDRRTVKKYALETG